MILQPEAVGLELLRGRRTLEYEDEDEGRVRARRTKDAIGFHRARAQSALAGGTRARNRLVQEARPGVILQPEAVGLELLRGRRTLEHEHEHEYEHEYEHEHEYEYEYEYEHEHERCDGL